MNHLPDFIKKVVTHFDRLPGIGPKTATKLVFYLLQDSEEAQSFADFKHWTYSPQLTQGQRQEILWDSHHTSSLFHVNLLQEYFGLFPELCWPQPADERINIPGKILPTNWTYRFRPSVEEIANHEELFSKMEKIIFSPNPIF